MILQTVASMFAMCMSWSFLWGSLYCMQLVFALTEAVDAELVRVINAFVLTAACIAAIFVGDGLADLFEESASASDPASEPLQPATLAVIDSERVPLPPLAKSPGHEDEPVFASSASRVLPAADDVSMGLRIILNSLGFLMALSWDKAFESAEETVAHYLEKECHFKHEVILKVLMAVILAGFLLPAWMKYIVPATMKEHSEHRLEIERSRSQHEEWELGLRGHRHHSLDDEESWYSSGSENTTVA